MSVRELLKELAVKRVTLKLHPDGDRFQVSADKGVITAELRERLALHKEALLALLRQDEQGLVSGDFVLPPIHRWYLGTHPLAPHHFNQSFLVRLPARVSTERLRRAVDLLAEHHDALRLRFHLRDGEWVAAFAAPAPDLVLPLEVHDLADLPRGEHARVVSERCARAQASFDLATGPIARVLYFDLGPTEAPRLFFAVHHFAVDGVSWRILFEDLEQLLGDESGTARLPRKTTSFKAASARLAEYARSAEVERQAEFWRGLPWKSATVLPTPRATLGAMTELVRTLEAGTTSALLTRALLPYRLRIDDALLTAFVLALRSVLGGDAQLLHLEGHGRDLPFDDVDLSRTVGWFTRMFPVLLTLPEGGSLGDALVAVKEQLRGFANHAPSFPLLRYLGRKEIQDELAALPGASILFNYLGQGLSGAYELAPEDSGPSSSPEARIKHAIALDAAVIDGKLTATLGVDPELVDAMTAERLLDAFLDGLTRIVHHVDHDADAGALTPSDVPSLRLGQQELDRITSRATGSRAAATDLYALTPLQEGLLFHNLKDEGEDAYIPQLVFSFDRSLDADALDRALQDLVARHDVLRTSFVWEDTPKPLQVVHARARFLLERLDWSDVSLDALEGRLQSFLDENRRRGFDLRAAPLTRGTLLRTADGFRLVWATHHIVSDGWSAPILIADLFAFYRHHAQGTPLALERTLRFGDYIDWLAAQDDDAARAFFERALDGFSEPTLLFPQAQASGRWSETSLDLSEDLSTDLVALAKRLRVTLSTLFHAAFALVLARYTGRHDVLFGSTTSGRAAPIHAVERIVGPFINASPARIRIPDAPVEDWLASLQAFFNELRSYEHIALTQAQAWSRVPKGQPLFEALLTVENYPADGTDAIKASVGLRGLRSVERTHYPFSLVVEPGARVRLGLSFDADRFSDLAPRALSHIQQALRAFVDAPSTSVRSVDIVSPDERRTLLDWNDTRRGFPSDRLVHQIFEDQVDRAPDATAVQFGDARLTYRELDDRANALAHDLRERGVRTGDIVALCLRRSLEMMVAVFGCMKAGACYAPLDPEHPRERLDMLVDDLAARTTLVTKDTLDLTRWPGAITLEVDGPTPTSPRLALSIAPDSAAYLIYTSGSTGKPKGVVNTHRGVLNHMLWMNDVYALSAADVVLQKTPYTFDVSIWELFLPLMVGATLVVARPDGHKDTSYLSEIFEAHRVTTVHFVASMLDAFLRFGDLAKTRSIRRVFCSGEAVPRDLVERFFASMPHAELHDLYGPTEAAIHVTSAKCAPDADVTIGRPIWNTQVHVVAQDLTPMPIGVPGELLLGGAGVARGYWKRPELTAEKFVPDPFSSNPGARLYRTGDLARWRSDGSLEYLGRIDHQVKIRGFRIELGEIEAALLASSGVAGAVVVAREDDRGNKRLVGYVVPAEGAHIDVPSLERALAKTLPEYMIPSAFVTLDAFPLTTSGKVDRKALPAPDVAAAADDYLAPRSEVETHLAAVFASVLRIPRVGVHDNFFALGGDSIGIIQIVSRARAHGLHLTVKDVYAAPTVAALASRAGSASKPLLADQGLVSGDLGLPPVHRWYLDATPIEPHHFNQSFLLRLPAHVSTDRLRRAVDRLAQHHDALRLRFHLRDAEWVAAFAPPEPDRVLPLEIVDLSALPRGEHARIISERCARAQASFDLARGPIARVLYFDPGPTEAPRLFLVIHHFAVDGVSWRVLFEDLHALLDGSSELPPKTSSFKDYAARLAQLARSQDIEQHADFWRNLPWQRASVLPAPRSTVAESYSLSRSLDEDVSAALLTRALLPYRLRIEDAVLTAFALAARSVLGGHAQLLHLEGHGRDLPLDDLDLSRTVGWFTRIFPVLLSLPESDSVADALVAVKEQLRSFSKHALSFPLLRYLGRQDLQHELAKLPLPPVLFNYLGQQLSGGFDVAAEDAGADVSPRATLDHAITVNSVIRDGRFTASIFVDPELVDREKANRLLDAFLDALAHIVRHVDNDDQVGALTPSDVASVTLDQAELDRITRRAAGSRAAVIDLYALTPLQEGFLFHHLKDEGEDAYIPQLVFSFDGSLEADALDRALQDLVARHDVFRTSIVWEDTPKPLQVVHARARFLLERLDWSDTPSAAVEQRLTHFLDDNRRRGFDLRQAPLTRGTLLRTHDGFRFVWATHHIVSDGWSLPILLSDLFALYKHHARRQPLAFEPAPRFGDYIDWLAAQTTDAAKAFFERALDGFSEPTLLFPQGQPTRRWAETSLDLPQDLSADLVALAKRLRVTLSTLFHAAFALVLARYTGRHDILFGTTTSGRAAPIHDIERIVGPFINASPVRVIIPDAPISDWLASLQDFFNQLRSFEHVAITQVQAWSSVPKDQPLFETLLTFENYPLDPATGSDRLASIGLRDLRGVERSHYPFALMVVPAQRIHLRLSFDADRFSDFAPRALDHIQQALRAFVDAPTSSVRSVDILTHDERRTLLVDWNATAKALDADLSLLSLFDAQVARSPDAVAVEFEGSRLTYRQLRDASIRIASWLLARVASQESCVTLELSRSEKMVAALLGVMRAGAAYVPIDPALPSERREFMRQDARVVAQIDDDLLAEALATEPGVVPQRTPVARDLAYILYTSGSTGRPKGVMVTHGALVNFMRSMAREPGLGPKDTLVAVTTLSFDIAGLELYLPLIVGAKVVIVSRDTALDATTLAARLQDSSATMMQATPATWAMLRASGWRPHAQLRILCGGEALPPDLANSLAADAAELWNLYGPTETTIWSTATRVRSGTAVTIGGPIDNTQTYILDRELQPVPVGVRGELCIGGLGIARGYRDRPALTAEKFIPDPFSSTPGARLYRTGDLARWRSDGTLEYLGRIDHQVKIRGFRIELGEIEAALLACDGVAAAVVLAREDVPGDKRLVAYVVPATGAQLEGAALKSALAKTLPEYMIPSAFVTLGAFPLTSSGKVDRKALPAPDVSAAADDYLAPRSDVETNLAAVFASVLRIPRVGVQDNFFALGGDSIGIIQVVSRARAHGLHLAVKDVYAAPTVAALATRAASASKTVLADQGLVSGDVVLPPVHRWYLDAAPIDPHHFNQSFLLRLPAHVTADRVRAALQTIARHHDALRLRFRFVEGGWTAAFAPLSDLVLPLDSVDLFDLLPQRQSLAISEHCARAQASFDLESGPIARAVFFHLGTTEPPRFFLVIHHFAVDGVSWRILFEDLHALLDGTRPSDLPPKTSSFKDYAARLAELARSEDFERLADFWRRLPWERATVLPAPRSTFAESYSLSRSLDPDLSAALLTRALFPYRLRVEEAILTAFALAARAVLGGDAQLLHLEGHGRDVPIQDLDLSRTVGWFTRIFPVLLSLPERDSVADALVAVKEQLRAFQAHATAFPLLRFLGRREIQDELAKLPVPPVLFNYLGQQLSDGFDVATEDAGSDVSARATLDHAITVNSVIRDGRFTASLSVDPKLVDPAKAESLLDAFLDALTSIVHHVDKDLDVGALTPSDVASVTLDQNDLDRITSRATGSRAAAKDLYALTPLQEGFLFHHLKDEGEDAYIPQLVFSFDGSLDNAALDCALQDLVARHDVLRTSFVWEDTPKPIQVVHAKARFLLERVDWSDTPSDAVEQRLAHFLDDNRKRGFDLRTAPLTRGTLLRTRDGFRFVWATHHIVSDGWSLPILLADFFALYRYHAHQQPLALEPAPRFGDYVDWLAAQRTDAAKAFFEQALDGCSEPTLLFPPGPPAQRWGAAELDLPLDLSSQLVALAKKLRVTLSTLFHAAFALVLARYTGRRDVLFGTTTSGRAAPIHAIERIVGPFINASPVRVTIPDAPVSDWLASLQDFFNQLRSFEHVAITQVQAWSSVPKGQPLFEALLTFENYPLDPATGTDRVASLGLRDLRGVERSHYPFALLVAPAQRIHLRLSFDADRFSDLARRALDHIQQALRAFVDTPSISIRSVDVLTPDERRTLLDWNDTRRVLPSDRLVHEIFEDQVDRTPNAVALELDDARLTYRELDDRANALAHDLLDRGVRTGDVVALCMQRSLEMVVAILGILKAGAAYAPLDVAWPTDRKRAIFRDLRARVLVTTPATPRESLPSEIDTLALVVRDALQRTFARPRARPHAASPAYAISTSGSTGGPKPVVVPHRALANHMAWIIDAFGIGAEDRLLQKTPASFDASVWELFAPLLVGATLVVASPDAHRDPVELVRSVADARITILQLVPTMLEAIVDVPGIERGTSLRLLFCGGELLRSAPVEAIREKLRLRVVNLYGPTETCIDSTSHVASADEGLSVSIGKPIWNTAAYVLDPDLRCVPIGVPGELCIGGDGLAHGYAGKPALTAEKFIPDPFSGTPGARLYRTGDLARWRSDGTLEYLGRIDHQVKIRGFRIELGEIEAALLACDGVAAAVVVAREDDRGHKRLVGYVVPAEGAHIDVPSLERALADTLPEYMIPSAFVALDAFPLTTSGKVDRKALPAPDVSAAADDYLAPRSDVETHLAAVFASVLRIPRVGVHDNFFALGGDSIGIIQIVSRARAHGLHLAVKDVYAAPTVAALATRAASASKSVLADQGLVSGDVVLPPVHRRYLDAAPIDPDHFNQSFLLRLPAHVTSDRARSALARIARHHDALRLRFRLEDGAWTACFAPLSDLVLPLDVVDLSDLPSQRQPQAIAEHCARAQASFDLANGPIARAVFFHLGTTEPPRLFLVIHHFAVDGVSWRILFEDLHALLDDDTDNLPPKTSSFKDYAARLAEHARSEDIERLADFWRRLPWERATVLPAPRSTFAESYSLSRSLDPDLSAALLTRALLPYRLRVEEAILTAFALAARSVLGGHAQLLHLEGHGRDLPFDDLDLSRTVGWFTRIFPVLFTLPEGDSVADALVAVKEQLRAFQAHATAFPLLRFLGRREIQDELAKLPAPPVLFNYLGQQLSGGFDVATEDAGSDVSARATLDHAITVNSVIRDGRFTASLFVDPKLVDPAKAESLLDAFLDALTSIVHHVDKDLDVGALTPSDVPSLSLVQRELDRITRRATGSRAAAKDLYALTPLQEGLLFHNLKDEAEDAYIPQIVFSFDGSLDADALDRALQDLVARHDVLRTSFVWEDAPKPLQVVHAEARFLLEHADWSDTPSDALEQRLAHFLDDNRKRGFDLRTAPLTRGTLLRTHDGFRFVWATHHIVSDGWSLPILLGDLFALYKHHAHQHPLALEPTPRFGDYVEWLSVQTTDAAKAFFQKALDGFSEPTLLLPAGPAPQRWGAAELELPLDLSADLVALAKRLRVTLSTLFHAAFALVLARYTGRNDVLFGSTTSGRAAPIHGIERIVGPFINASPIRVRISEQPIQHWLTSLQDFFNDLRSFEHVALNQVHAWSNVPLGQPLFEALLTFENYPLDPVTGGDRSASIGLRDLRGVERTHYPFALTVVPAARVRLELSFDLDRFGDVGQRTLRHLERTLQAFADSNARADRIDMLSDTERREVLVTGRGPGLPVEALTVHEQFERQARTRPDAPAIVTDHESLTYAELNARANRLARFLRQRGVGSEDRVATWLPRSADMVVAELAVIKAGAAYVPLDPSHPSARIAYVVTDVGAEVVLSTRAVSAALLLDGLETELFCLDDPATVAALAAERADDLALACPRNQAAYVIYTSGTTGQPKGSVIEHASLANLVAEHRRAARVGPNDRVTQISGPAFDATSNEIWPTLAAGAALYIVSDELRMSPDELLAWFERNEITITDMPTALAATVLDADWSRTRVRFFSVGGEALRRRPRPHDPFELINQYGPTETTDYVTWEKVEPGDAPVSTIGRPIQNTAIYVLDGSGQLVPPGVFGEIHVGGRNVGRGYFGNPALTAERFVPDPFAQAPGARMYRTGDRGRWLSDGRLEYGGRSDDQVKVRGFRVEPGEIEAVLRGLPGVRDAVVVARPGRAGDLSLVAYVVGSPAPFVELARELASSLPAYMVPSAFVALDALPLTPNGKVDRRALPAPDFVDTRAEYVAPRDRVESELVEVFRDVLRTPRIGVHDDFFALGGHSLLAMRAISRIRGVLGVDISVRALFEAPTVARLAALVRSSGAARVRDLEPVDHSSPLPASFAQARLWFLDQFEGPSATYNVPFVVRLVGPLDAGALERALQAMVLRHAALRTTFTNIEGVAHQIVHANMTVGLTRHTAGSEAEARELVAASCARPFDLARGPLVHAALVRIGEQDHRFALTIHHIATDGWSSSILMRDLSRLYAAFLRGEPSPLPPLRVDYPDFAVREREWLSGERLGEKIAFWKQHLADAPPALELVTDRPRPTRKQYRGAIVSVPIPAPTSAALRSLCRRIGATPFMVFLTAFQALLSRWSRQSDVVVGTPIANRTRQDLEGIVGFFVNTLAFRSTFRHETSFQAAVDHLKRAALAAYAHQDLPFEKLVDELDVVRDTSRNPVFQAMFVFNVDEGTPLELAGLEVHEEPAGDVAEKFDLTLGVHEKNGVFSGAISYDVALFDRSTIELFARHFVTFLSAAIDRPDSAVSMLPLMTEDELRTVLVEWNGTQRTVDNQDVVDRIRRHAEVSPSALALRDDTTSLTFAELEAQSNRLAHVLRRRGVGREDRIATLFQRSTAMIVAQLAVMKAGAAYVPLDPAHPPDRLRLTVADAGAKLVLTESKLRSTLSDAAAALFLDDPSLRAEVGREPAAPPAVTLRPNQAAYVIYTSGTTGKPKGAILEHRGLTNVIETRARFSGITSADRLSQIVSPAFDASVWETWPALARGASLHIVSDDVRQSPADLVVWLREHAISIAFLPTVLAEAILDQDWSHAALRVLETAGDALKKRPPAGVPFRFANLYGPTEATVCTSAGDVTPEGDGAPSIGRPIDNARVYILSDAGLPCPIGVPGELCVAGVPVGRGYLGRPELTAEKFAPDPFSTEPGARLYRTGDLARWRHDGTLEFLGRVDQQVKIRGFRIELGEIEAALGSCDGVAAAVAVVREDVTGNKRLVGYVVPAPGAAVDPGSLRSKLAKTLPDYMVPSAFVVLEALPLTTSGKVDRKALPEPSRTDTHKAAPAETPLEGIVANVFEQVLGVRGVGRHDDFFALGGHSILAMRAASMLQGVGRRKLRLRDVFEAKTVAALARCLEVDSKDAAEMPPLVRTEVESGSVVAFVHELMIGFEADRRPSRVWTAVQSFALLGRLDVPRLFAAIRMMLERQESLRQTFDKRTPTFAPRLCRAEEVRIEQIELDTDDAVQELTTAQGNATFEVQGEPLIRFTLVRRNEARHYLVVTWHQSVNDPSAILLMRRELAESYEAIAEGRTPRLTQLPVRYSDYAQWERSWFVDGEGRRHIERVRARLEGAMPLRLADKPSDDRVGPDAIETSFELDQETSDRFAASCRKAGLTPFIALTAVFSVQLALWAGQDDVVFISPVNLRNLLPELSHLMGRLLNVVFVRISLAGNPTWTEVFARARNAIIEAFADERTPASLVLGTRDVYGHPLSRVIFNMPDLGGGPAPEPIEGQPSADLEVSIHAAVSTSGARGDLAVVLGTSEEGRLNGFFRGAVDRFEPETIQEQTRRLCELLRTFQPEDRPLQKPRATNA